MRGEGVGHEPIASDEEMYDKQENRENNRLEGLRALLRDLAEAHGWDALPSLQPQVVKYRRGELRLEFSLFSQAVELFLNQARVWVRRFEVNQVANFFSRPDRYMGFLSNTPHKRPLIGSLPANKRPNMRLTTSRNVVMVGDSVSVGTTAQHPQKRLMIVKVGSRQGTQDTREVRVDSPGTRSHKRLVVKKKKRALEINKHGQVMYCRFGQTCSRKDCTFAHHALPEEPPSIATKRGPCKFGINCKRPDCYFAHPTRD